MSVTHAPKGSIIQASDDHGRKAGTKRSLKTALFAILKEMACTSAAMRIALAVVAGLACEIEINQERVSLAIGDTATGKVTLYVTPQSFDVCLRSYGVNGEYRSVWLGDTQTEGLSSREEERAIKHVRDIIRAHVTTVEVPDP